MMRGQQKLRNNDCKMKEKLKFQNYNIKSRHLLSRSWENSSTVDFPKKQERKFGMKVS